jgi:hypothetical protein
MLIPQEKQAANRERPAEEHIGNSNAWNEKKDSCG